MVFYTFHVITQWAVYVLGIAAGTPAEAVKIARADCQSARKEDIKHSIPIRLSERPGLRYSIIIENENYEG